MKKILVLSFLMGVAGADEHHHPAAPPNPTFDKLKTLAGSWEGTAKDSGKEFPAVVPGAPNQVVFEFTDGTNIGPNDGHMQKIIFTFDGPDHHIEEWVYRDKGKDSTGRFDFKRKK
jgi:hypothetical protein